MFAGVSAAGVGVDWCGFVHSPDIVKAHTGGWGYFAGGIVWRAAFNFLSDVRSCLSENSGMQSSIARVISFISSVVGVFSLVCIAASVRCPRLRSIESSVFMIVPVWSHCAEAYSSSVFMLSWILLNGWSWIPTKLNAKMSAILKMKSRIV